MEYEINVAKPTPEGYFSHYFRVTVSYGKVKTVYEEMKKNYPDCSVTVTCWQKTGKKVDMEKCDF